MDPVAGKAPVDANLFSNHFGDDENEEGSAESAAREEINQRITRRGSHGDESKCDHKR